MRVHGAPRALEAPGLAADPGARWAQVAVSGALVAVSGQVAVDEHGELVGRDSARAQAEQVFANVGRALAAAGCGVDRVLKLTVFLRELADLAAVREVRDRWLGDARPASTLVQVAGFVDDSYLLEVEAWAVAPHG